MFGQCSANVWPMFGCLVNVWIVGRVRALKFLGDAFLCLRCDYDTLQKKIFPFKSQPQLDVGSEPTTFGFYDRMREL